MRTQDRTQHDARRTSSIQPRRKEARARPGERRSRKQGGSVPFESAQEQVWRFLRTEFIGARMARTENRSSAALRDGFPFRVTTSLYGGYARGEAVLFLRSICRERRCLRCALSPGFK